MTNQSQVQGNGDGSPGSGEIQPSAENAALCEKCGCDTKGEMAFMDHVGESWCHPCADSHEEARAEAAWDRHQESLMSGDTPTFRETYLAAYEQKRSLK